MALETLPLDARNVRTNLQEAVSEEIPEISVVVCTRNRGENVARTIQTVMENHFRRFELVVIDQSTNVDAATAIEQFTTDPRFRYIHSATVGTGRSRNIGLTESKGGIVIYTD